MLKLVTAGAALIFVVALIFVTAAFSRWLNPWIASRFAPMRLRLRHTGHMPGKTSGEKLVSHVDQKRRLHVTDMAGCRFAILTGGPSDVMILIPTHFNHEHES